MTHMANNTHTRNSVYAFLYQNAGFLQNLYKINSDPFHISECLARQGQQMFGWQQNHVVQGAVQYQQHMQEAKEHQCNINSMQWAAEVPQVFLNLIQI